MPDSSPSYRRVEATVRAWPQPVGLESGATAAESSVGDWHWARVPPSALFVVFLVAALALQARMGAFRVEQGVYSDDAAHLMNGLLVRDYLHHGLGSDPIGFAEQYYLSYPKIAPLMWPPLFHVVLGLWMLPGWPAAPTAMFLVALCLAWTTWRLYHIVDHLAGPLAGLVAAGLFDTTPLVMGISSVVMLDIVIAAMSLEATYWLARFVRSSLVRDAVLYGLFTAATCLTKGNGWALVLVAPVSILLTRRFDLLRKPGLYLAGAIVVVFAAPLAVVSARFDAGIGDFAPVGLTDVIHRAAFYGSQLWTNVGPALLGLATIGSAVVVVRVFRRQSVGVPLAEALLALVSAAILFHLLNPHRVAAARYMTMTVAPIIGLAIAGSLSVAQKMRTNARRRLALAAIVVASIVATVAERPHFAARLPLGYRRVVTQLAADNGLAGRRVLVVSDEVGEGAMVTEAAVRALEPAPTIIRASKLLASDDWMGNHFKMNYNSPASLMQDLEDLHVDYLLLDRSGQSAQLPYFEQVRSLTDTDRLERIETPAQNTAMDPTRELDLYRVRTKSPGPPKSLQISLTYTLGRTLRK